MKDNHQPQPTTNLPTTPTKPTSLSKKIKYPLLILFVLLPFIGFYAGVRYQQSIVSGNSPLSSQSDLPRSLANWKTYTNPQYHYTFQYQTLSDFELRSCGSNPQDFSGHQIVGITIAEANMTTCFPLESPFEIQIHTEPGDTASHTYYQTSEFMNKNGSDWQTTSQTIDIADTRGIKTYLTSTAEDPSGCCTNYIETRFFHQDQTYVITYTGTIPSLLPIYNQILDTLTFTN